MYIKIAHLKKVPKPQKLIYKLSIKTIKIITQRRTTIEFTKICRKLIKIKN